MWIVLFIVMLDVIGFGIIGPILPLYIDNLGGSPAMVTFCVAVFPAALFISTPILGRLSDIYGRKPIMVISLIGSVIGYVALAFAESILMIVILRIISGLLAGNYGAAQAYMTDISTPEDRAKFMGYFGAALGLGFVIGPAIGSILGGDSLEELNFFLPCITAAAMSFAALIGLLLFVKETAPVKDSDKEAEAGVTTEPEPGFIKATQRTFKNKLLITVIICGSMYHLASGFFEAPFPLWAADTNIISAPSDMAPILLLSGFTLVLVQGFLIAPLNRRFSEKTLLISCAIGFGVSLYAVTIAGDFESAIGVTIIFSIMYGFAGVILTCSQTLVSKCAKDNERGAVLGVFSSVGTLGRTATTLLSGVIYGYIHYHAIYYAAILAMLVLIYLASKINLQAIDNIAHTNSPVASPNDN